MKELNTLMLSKVAGGNENRQEVYTIHTISLTGPFNYQDTMGIIVAVSSILAPALGAGAYAMKNRSIRAGVLGGTFGFFVGVPVTAGVAKLTLGYSKWVYDTIA